MTRLAFAALGWACALAGAAAAQGVDEIVSPRDGDTVRVGQKVTVEMSVTSGASVAALQLELRDGDVLMGLPRDGNYSGTFDPVRTPSVWFTMPAYAVDRTWDDVASRWLTDTVWTAGSSCAVRLVDYGTGAILARSGAFKVSSSAAGARAVSSGKARRSTMVPCGGGDVTGIDGRRMQEAVRATHRPTAARATGLRVSVQAP